MAVNHPSHYQHPSGIKAIDVCECENFNIGNALKDLRRRNAKGGVEDLRKAEWYIQREIARLEKDGA